MEQEQTPKQVQPEDTETIQIEERDAKRELNKALYYSKLEIPMTRIPSIALNLDVTFNYSATRASILLWTPSCRCLLSNPNSPF